MRNMQFMPHFAPRECGHDWEKNKKSLQAHENNHALYKHLRTHIHFLEMYCKW